jgi:hypothetical protein
VVGRLHPGDQLSIFVEQVALPSEQERRETLVDELEQAIGTVLDDHGLDRERIKVIDGHTYSMIEDDCPQCGDRLEVLDLEPDASNGALATALCDCGWHGTAIYRLIDLHEPHPAEETGEEDSATSHESSVRRYGIDPKYLPY